MDIFEFCHDPSFWAEVEGSRTHLRTRCRTDGRNSPKGQADSGRRSQGRSFEGGRIRSEVRRSQGQISRGKRKDDRKACGQGSGNSRQGSSSGD